MDEISDRNRASFADPASPERALARKAQIHYAPAESRALGTLAILATLAILWIVVPIGIGVLIGTLLAFTTHPYYRALAHRTKRPTLVAFTLTAAATLLVTGTVGIIGYLLLLRGLAVAEMLPQSLGPDGPLPHLAETLRAPLAALKIDPATLVDRLRQALGGVASQLAGWAADILAVLADGALAVFFLAFTMFFVLRHWAELAKRAEYLLPFNPRHTRHLLNQMRRVGRTVVIGNFGTAAVQGLLGGVGYGLGHLPQWPLLGALTAVSSLVPVVGTMVIWVPAGLLLLLFRQTNTGLFELGWGLIVTTIFCDYVVRPRLIGRGSNTSTWLTFVGLFGGIKLFGFIGLLLGPLIVETAIDALRLYERVRKFRLGLK
jgi:predicted PurR-regulated permease PerM